MSTPPMLSVEARAEPLRRLRAELASYGLQTRLMPDAAAPYVFTALPATYGETVRVEDRDGQACFVWHEAAADHPTIDPAGAARRIATALRRERRDAEGSQR